MCDSTTYSFGGLAFRSVTDLTSDESDLMQSFTALLTQMLVVTKLTSKDLNEQLLDAYNNAWKLIVIKDTFSAHNKAIRYFSFFKDDYVSDVAEFDVEYVKTLVDTIK